MTVLPHSQKIKLKHKIGRRKKELENYYGIKTMKPVVQKESKPVIESTEVSLKKSKPKKKSI